MYLNLTCVYSKLLKKFSFIYFALMRIAALFNKISFYGIFIIIFFINYLYYHRYYYYCFFTNMQRCRNSFFRNRSYRKSFFETYF